MKTYDFVHLVIHAAGDGVQGRTPPAAAQLHDNRHERLQHLPMAVEPQLDAGLPRRRRLSPKAIGAELLPQLSGTGRV